ncbi:MAG: methionyl-tRNA formyltransferase [bacterium P3]|nr:MAG: methionyl-tRNA formyltransferase [bacterium P3]KWW40495.1 MAG: methionyl-tRNA formyltransferase [bacterium F083]
MTVMKPRIVFMGTPDFAVSSLEAILAAGYEVAAVVTTPDRPAGRGQKTTASAVKHYALEHALPLMQPEKLRDPDFLQALQALQADMFVVVAFRMLPQCVWAMPPMGTFNLHASLLPRYRGAAPINWAIINGEQETGVTTFLLNEHIDEGSILMQASTPINDDDTAETLHDRLAVMGQRLVAKTIEGLATNRLTPRPQPGNDGCTSYPAAPKIFKEDCRIPWELPGKRIHDFVRGLSPYPAAIMHLIDGKGMPQSIKVFETRFEASGDSKPRQLYSDGKSYLKVGTTDGFVHIISLQLNGKRRVGIADFLRGYDISNWILNC